MTNEEDIKTNEGKVIKALEKSNYKWRTIAGITKDTDLSPSNVMITVNKLQQTGTVIQASMPNNKGEPVYATANSYDKNTSLSNRIISSLSGKVL